MLASASGAGSDSRASAVLTFSAEEAVATRHIADQCPRHRIEAEHDTGHESWAAAPGRQPRNGWNNAGAPHVTRCGCDDLMAPRHSGVPRVAKPVVRVARPDAQGSRRFVPPDDARSACRRPQCFDHVSGSANGAIACLPSVDPIAGIPLRPQRQPFAAGSCAPAGSIRSITHEIGRCTSSTIRSVGSISGCLVWVGVGVSGAGAAAA